MKAEEIAKRLDNLDIWLSRNETWENDLDGYDSVDVADAVMSKVREQLEVHKPKKFSGECNLSTTTGCPECNNENVHLVQNVEVIYKFCEKCKTIFLCEDACGIFTEPDIKI